MMVGLTMLENEIFGKEKGSNDTIDGAKAEKDMDLSISSLNNKRFTQFHN